MKRQKKTQLGKSFGIMIFFLLFSMITIFSLYFVFVTGNNYIAVPLTNITQAVEYDSNIEDAIINAGQTYQDTNLGFIDYGFTLGLVFLTGGCFYLGYHSRKYNYYSFLGLLLYGLMFVLFVISLIEITTNTFYNVLINLFPTLMIDLPIFNWFMDNLGVYLLVLSGLMLLLNQLEFDIYTIMNRKQQDLDDGEIL